MTFVDSDDYINDSYLVLPEDKDIIFASYRSVVDGCTCFDRSGHRRFLFLGLLSQDLQKTIWRSDRGSGRIFPSGQ